MHANDNRDSLATGTQRKNPFASIRALYKRLVDPPCLPVQLKDASGVLSPRMSRKEIRRVATQICRAALRDAK